MPYTCNVLRKLFYYRVSKCYAENAIFRIMLYKNSSVKSSVIAYIVAGLKKF